MNKITLPQEYKYIAAFLTMRCNLNCSFCLNASDKSFSRRSFEEIGGGKWVEALNRIEPKPNVPITFCGGEPTVHQDFIYILNNLKPKLEIDILTNLRWGERGIEKFIKFID